MIQNDPPVSKKNHFSSPPPQQTPFIGSTAHIPGRSYLPGALIHFLSKRQISENFQIEETKRKKMPEEVGK